MAKDQGKAPSKTLALVAGVLVLGGGGAALADYVVPSKVVAGTTVDGIDIGGLTQPEALAKIKAGFDKRTQGKVVFRAKGFKQEALELSWSELGVQFDPQAMAEKLPLLGPVRHAMLSLNGPEKKVNLQYRVDNEVISIKPLKAFVDEHKPDRKPARVFWAGGKPKPSPEIPSLKLDEPAVLNLIEQSFNAGSEVELPLIAEDQKVSQKDLDSITTVVSEYTTSFSTGKVSRCLNIKRAAEIIDGLVLLPGEKFSFNDFVGRRTTANGFHVAGVYVSGRHDVDVGGGICQVSTTIYNTLLLCEMKVDKRNPHSLPVPYVPLGRDAAVSFPNPDLAFTNNLGYPIALSATYSPGKLTFRVVGREKYGKQISFESKLIDSWSHGIKYENDPSLPYGVQKVVDSGGSGRSVRTWKIVKVDGQEVERVDLGVSTYSGGPRIVARNNNAKPPQAPKPATGESPGTATPSTPQSPPSSNPTSGA